MATSQKEKYAHIINPDLRSLLQVMDGCENPRLKVLFEGMAVRLDDLGLIRQLERTPDGRLLKP